jgi:hypothetical protein
MLVALVVVTFTATYKSPSSITVITTATKKQYAERGGFQTACSHTIGDPVSNALPSTSRSVKETLIVRFPK